MTETESSETPSYEPSMPLTPAHPTSEAAFYREAPEAIPEYLEALITHRADLAYELLAMGITFEAFKARVIEVLPRHLQRPIKRCLAWVCVPEEAAFQLFQEASAEEHRQQAPAREAAAEAVAQARAEGHALAVQRKAQLISERIKVTRGRPPGDPRLRELWLEAKAKRQAQILQLADAGHRHDAIAAAVGCSKGHVYAVLNRAGKCGLGGRASGTGTRGGLSAEQKAQKAQRDAEIIHRRESGLPPGAIAAAVGCSVPHVYATLSRSGKGCGQAQLSDEQKAQVITMRAAGSSVSVIAQTLNRSADSVYWVLRAVKSVRAAAA